MARSKITTVSTEIGPANRDDAMKPGLPASIRPIPADTTMMAISARKNRSLSMFIYSSDFDTQGSGYHDYHGTDPCDGVGESAGKQHDRDKFIIGYHATQCVESDKHCSGRYSQPENY